MCWGGEEGALVPQKANKKEMMVVECNFSRDTNGYGSLEILLCPQVLEMFILVLQQCHRENEDKWKRLSRQIADIILPMLAKQQVNLIVTYLYQ